MDKEVAEQWQRWLIQDVLEYCQVTPEELTDQLCNRQPWKDNAFEWGQYPDIQDFYKHNYTQFWDEVHFHLNPKYWIDHFQFDRVKGARILDFGCGIGSSAIYQAVNNFVIGYEINDKCLDFCKFRNAKFRYDNLIFTNVMPELKDFDLIMAIDVLEHIPNLREVLLDWGSQLKPGAHLYHADVFEDHPSHHPMHFDFGNDIDKWLIEAGFKIASFRVAVKT